MKKHFFLILFIILFFSFAQAQRHRDNSFAGINCSAEVNYYGIYVVPTFTCDYKKSTFAIGPAFNVIPYYSIIPKKQDYYYPITQQFIGGRVSYSNLFFSSRRNNHINLFFNLNLTYHHIVFSDYQNYTTKVIDQFVKKAQFLGFYFGLGDIIYYKSGLYLNPSIDWGATIYEKLGTPPIFAIPDRGYLSNAMVISFGLGYIIQ